MCVRKPPFSVIWHSQCTKGHRDFLCGRANKVSTGRNNRSLSISAALLETCGCCIRGRFYRWAALASARCAERSPSARGKQWVNGWLWTEGKVQSFSGDFPSHFRSTQANWWTGKLALCTRLFGGGSPWASVISRRDEVNEPPTAGRQEWRLAYAFFWTANQRPTGSSKWDFTFQLWNSRFETWLKPMVQM